MNSTENPEHESHNSTKSSISGNKESGTNSPSLNASTQSFSVGRFIACLYLIGVFYGVSIHFSLNDLKHNHRLLQRANCSAYLFSEERAMMHVVELAEKIGHRQEGSSGILLAVNYLTRHLDELSVKAKSTLRFEIDKSLVSGSFNLNFLERSMTMMYQNLTNIAVRLSAAASDPTTAAVLVNSHFDSALYSPGASDCAGCVACMLEVIRQIVESEYTPAAPLIFLFNGGEEIFMKAAHGFVSSHPWAPQVGALINLESSGSSLPDLLIQSGPGSWPSRVFSQAAVLPVASSVANDVFPAVPGDTDYRIFSQDFDTVPGLDFAVLLGGHTYHTERDTPSALLPGVLQTRGDNLLPLITALSLAPELSTRAQRKKTEAATGSGSASASASASLSLDSAWGSEGSPVYFDVLGRFTVQYGRGAAMAAHLGLAAALLTALPHLTTAQHSGSAAVRQRYDDLAMAAACYLLSWLLAMLLPALCALMRVSATGRSFNWLSQPHLLLPLYVPAALAGLLIPHAWRRGATYTRSASPGSGSGSGSLDVRLAWSNHWGGTVGFNALAAASLTMAGLGTAFVPFWWAVFLLPSLHLTRLAQRLAGPRSPLSLLPSLALALLPTLFCLQFYAVFAQFVGEVMARAGTLPLPYGPYVPDVALALLCGVLTAVAVAPLAPLLSAWLAHPHFIRALLYASIAAGLYTSRLFPYSPAVPKRLVLQQVHRSDPATNALLACDYNLATADAIDATFVLQHVPALRAALGGRGEQLRMADQADLLPFYPLSLFLGRSLSAPAPPWHTADAHTGEAFVFPFIRQLDAGEGEEAGRRRVYLEVNFGSLHNVWGAVLNVTGPLVGWSLADGQLPPPEVFNGGPPSYIVHYGGGSSAGFQLWMEALGRRALRVELGVLDHKISEGVESLKRLMPDWIGAGSSSTYVSTYFF